MSEYVLVPVPEEHVAMVKQYLTWGGKAPDRDPWDGPAIAALLAGVDAATRELLEGVAADLGRDHVTRVGEAAARLQVSHREALGLLIELNERVKQLVEGQIHVVWPRRGPADEDDSHEIGNWVIGMTDEAATHIRAHTGDEAAAPAR